MTGQTNIFYDIGGEGERETKRVFILFHIVLASKRVSAEPVDC